MKFLLCEKLKTYQRFIADEVLRGYAQYGNSLIN